MKTFDHSKEAEDPSFGGCSMICIPFRQPEVPLKCVLVILRAQKGRKSVFLSKMAAQGQ